MHIEYVLEINHLFKRNIFEKCFYRITNNTNIKVVPDQNEICSDKSEILLKKIKKTLKNVEKSEEIKIT